MPVTHTFERGAQYGGWHNNPEMATGAYATPRNVRENTGARRLESSNMSSILSYDTETNYKQMQEQSRPTTARYSNANSDNMTAVLTYDKHDPGNPADKPKEKKHYYVGERSTNEYSMKPLDGRAKSPGRNVSSVMSEIIQMKNEHPEVARADAPISPHQHMMRNRNMSCDLTGLLQHQDVTFTPSPQRKGSMFDILAHSSTQPHDATGEATPRSNLGADGAYTPTNHYRTGPPPDMAPVVPDLLKHNDTSPEWRRGPPQGIRTNYQQKPSGEYPLFQTRKALPHNERSADFILGTDGRYTNPFGDNVQKERTRIIGGKIVTEYL